MMKITKIYSGTWLPRTTQHLYEFYKFLQYGECESGLSASTAKHLRQQLRPSQISLHRAEIDYVEGRLADYDFRFLEDGVIYVSLTAPKQPEEEMTRQRSFFLNKVLQALSYVYSQGAPIPKIFSQVQHILPTYVVVSQASESQISQFFKAEKDRLADKLVDQKTAIYNGEKINLFIGQPLTAQEIEDIILTREFANQLSKVLRVHRIIWDEITILREKQKIRYKDLIEMRDSLFDTSNDISFIKTRLAQMEHFIDIRLKSRQTKKITVLLQSDLTNRFISLTASYKYLTDLWLMTKEYADNTLNLVKMLYEASLQREISILQIIFIIGAGASFLTLGALDGAQLQIFDAAGQVSVVGRLLNFDLSSLLKFGVMALIFSVTLYAFVHLVLNYVKKISLVKVSKTQSSLMLRIKKWLV